MNAYENDNCFKVGSIFWGIFCALIIEKKVLFIIEMNIYGA
jgi:hypothetical protein